MDVCRVQQFHPDKPGLPQDGTQCIVRRDTIAGNGAADFFVTGVDGPAAVCMGNDEFAAVGKHAPHLGKRGWFVGKMGEGVEGDDRVKRCRLKRHVVGGGADEPEGGAVDFPGAPQHAAGEINTGDGGPGARQGAQMRQQNASAATDIKNRAIFFQIEQRKDACGKECVKTTIGTTIPPGGALVEELPAVHAGTLSPRAHLPTGFFLNIPPLDGFALINGPFALGKPEGHFGQAPG